MKTPSGIRLLFSGSILFIFATLFTSCSGPDSEKDHPTDQDTLSVTKDSTIAPGIIVRRDFDHIYNDIARYISGMSVDSATKINKSYLDAPDWKKYAVNAEVKWKTYDSTRMDLLEKWTSEELDSVNANTNTLFYPFSGPDILNANIFFPDAKQYILVGLEPVGSVPFLEKTNMDTVAKYFNSINTSLYAILNFSFFRTIAMKKDLKQEGVDGTIPLLMIFLARRGNEILEVKKCTVDSTGSLSFGVKGRASGVQITFRKDTLHNEQVLYYFSTDLSNEGLGRTNKEFSKYISSLGPVTSYLKSASYLMHMDFFSKIREHILAQSKYLLQDDSGIPFRFFPETGWKISLYGRYNGVISLFKGNQQADLSAAYKKDSSNIKKLPFGIGYKWHLGESNLMLAKRTMPIGEIGRPVETPKIIEEPKKTDVPLKNPKVRDNNPKMKVNSKVVEEDPPTLIENKTDTLK